MTAGSVRRRILRASVAHNAAANLDDGKAAVAHFHCSFGSHNCSFHTVGYGPDGFAACRKAKHQSVNVRDIIR